MDELNFQIDRLKKKHQKIEPAKKPKTKTSWQALKKECLLGIILVLGCSIFIFAKEENKEIFKHEVFEKSLSFTKLNNWYTNLFGSPLPVQSIPSGMQAVNESVENFEYQKYHDGIIAYVPKESTVNTLNSGIVVFIGEKENYGPIVIVQGIDGVDVWYGNITNINVSLYDYVEKQSIIGSAIESHIYYVIEKDGMYLNYDEYLSQI